MCGLITFLEVFEPKFCTHFSFLLLIYMPLASHSWCNRSGNIKTKSEHCYSCTKWRQISPTVFLFKWVLESWFAPSFHGQVEYFRCYKRKPQNRLLGTKSLFRINGRPHGPSCRLSRCREVYHPDHKSAPHDRIPKQIHLIHYTRLHSFRHVTSVILCEVV